MNVMTCRICTRRFVDMDKFARHEKTCIDMKQAELDREWEEKQQQDWRTRSVLGIHTEGHRQ